MKHITRWQPLGLGLLFSFFLSLSGMAQTHTPKYVSMCSKSNAYYEYLPQGYDPNGSTTYPLILFMTGIGEFGSGSAAQLPYVLKWGVPKLINDGKFPTSFTSGGQTHRFIVITPQFLKGSEPKPDDMNTVLNYIVAHYKVNLSRIYITGLSYGGGLSFAYAGRNATYAARIAAIVPTASPIPLPTETGYDTIYARSRVIAAANIPVWATHNSGDTPDSAARTIAYIDNINQAPAPNPLAKKTIFAVGGHDSWTKTYDLNFRENGYNIFEWMLLYQKGSTPPPPNQAPTANAGVDKTITLPANSVTLSGAGTDSDGNITAYNWTKVSGPTEGTITSPTAATTTITGLAQGIYTFRLMVSDNVSAKGVDDVKVTVKFAAGTKAIQVNVYGGSNAYSSTAWNNWNVGTVAASNVTSTAFKYFDGTTSPVTAVLSRTLSMGDNTSVYGDGMAPAAVLRYAGTDSITRTLTLQGLSATKTYKLELYASRNSTTAGSTKFTVNGTPVTINAVNNFDNKAVFSNATPDASGQLVITISRLNLYNYLNGFTLIENATAPPPPPATRYVKANIYGGTNPYANAQWNDWNVSASKTFNALKYSDATVSAINAVLSASAAVSDNGSTYGGTMAPPEVLRYTSYYNSLRTLTFSGLSTTSTYNLELYASRGNTGNSSIFTIGSTSVTIVSDNNKTNAATFSSLVPNSSGQIVVSINKTGTYSYLNGFVLTENNGSGSFTRAAPHAVQEVAAAGLQKPVKAGLSIYPNPTSGRVLLTLNNNYAGAMQVQVIDAAGKNQKTFRFVKASPVLQQSLPLDGLSKGVYFIMVQMGAQRQAIPISKF